MQGAALNDDAAIADLSGKRARLVSPDFDLHGQGKEREW
jgi:hypothetical protein